MENRLIGREKEIQVLNEISSSDKAEMLVVYGRRRIGKTYLIKEYYKSKDKTFLLTLTGIANNDTRAQIRAASNVLKDTCDIKINSNDKWDQVFNEIKNFHFREKDMYNHFVIFIDEMPWIATAKSGFIGALGSIWNTYFQDFKNVTFILCGSAAAWMLKNVVSNKSEFHGRITRKIILNPFTLKESEQYLKYKGFDILRKQVVQYYLTFGGVAHYFNLLNPTKSYTQNINELFFTDNSLLFNEFPQLFNSLFGRTPHHKKIIEYLGKKITLHYDINEIAKHLKISKTNTYPILEELEAAGFIKSQNFYEQKKRDTLYSLCDPFCFFYLHWVAPVDKRSISENISYWQTIVMTQKFTSWCGYAFELVCHNHILQIKDALGISGVQTTSYYWSTKARDNQKGAQIDLLIKRADKTVTIVECKYYEVPFEISEFYEANLRNKIAAFRNSTKDNSAITIVMLTANGTTCFKGVSLSYTDLTIDNLFT